jgi:glycerol 3-phosphatase-2
VTSSSAGPLARAYDLAMLDLDGVVYVGRDAVPGAAEHLASARAAGLRLAFITNNASRPPEAVAEHLVDLGVDAAVEDVVTSAQAAARVLVERLGAGARVVLLGGLGLEVALREAGLVAVGVDDEADAVVSGYGPDVRWADIMRAAVRIRDGLWWVASNTDGSIPTPYGIAPGHGVLVDTVRRFSGVEPAVAGKPSRPLLDETVRRVGGERPLMVGDRLDTDIEGARAVGIDSLLVLTGVTGLAELVAAREAERPTYVGVDLAALLEPCTPATPVAGGGWEAGGWTATVHDGRLRVSGSGTADDWWRSVAAAAWGHLDATGAAVDTSDATPPGRADAAPGR